MNLVTNLATVQNRVKDSMAASPVVGLVVRANGEERTKVITRLGVAYLAEITQPTTAPTTAVNTVTGNLPPAKWYAYRYVYAASKAYPLVESLLSINGQICPRGNPSPLATHQTHATLASGTDVTVATVQAAAGRPDIDEIWLFRTHVYSTSLEAQNAANAGLLYFKNKVANNPAVATVIIQDTSVGGVFAATEGVDQIELDNFGGPTGQFVHYYDPYWFIFGNHTFHEIVTWVAGTGVITLASGSWFDGRNGQGFILSGVTTGGYDGNGAYKFKWLTATTAQATVDGTTPTTLPVMGGGTQFITIQGPSTTLYRSKARNPFSWGWTRVIGTSIESLQFALKVGGGIGTAIASVPNEPILKLDTEFPAKCYGYNLQLVDNFDTFKQTQRTISDVFSVTSHFSQFVAATKEGQNVLWGMDYKNFAILQSNGISQYPISGPIPKILRLLTQDRQRQFLAHGLFDPYTELNCVWVTTANSPYLVDFLIYQHAPTGFWGFADEHDLLCSANITDPDTGLTNSFGGTQSGFFGPIFTKGIFSNWLPITGTVSGTITAATATTITHAAAPFNLVDPGLVGNWVLVTDANDQNEAYAHISAVAAQVLTIDRVITYPTGTPFVNPATGAMVVAVDFGANVPVNGWKFYVGLIECKALKYFDFGAPITDKQLVEFWCNQRDVDIKTLIRFYREYGGLPESQFTPESQNYETGANTLSEAHFNKDSIYSQLVKYFGLEIINRGYKQWEIKNIVLKPRLAP